MQIKIRKQKVNLFIPSKKKTLKLLFKLHRKMKGSFTFFFILNSLKSFLVKISFLVLSLNLIFKKKNFNSLIF